jgi:Tfp pilus assembly protein PilO
MPKKETKNLITVLFLLNVSALAFWYAIFSFTQGQISDTIEKEGKVKMEIVKKETNFLMKNDIKYGKDYENNLYSYVVPADGSVEVIKTIEELASISKLTLDIKSIDYEQQEKMSKLNLEYLAVNLSVLGSLNNIENFVSLLEKYPLKIDIKDISLNKVSGEGNKTAQWVGVIDLNIIKFK